MSDTLSAVRAALESRPRAEASEFPSAPGVVLYKVMNKVFAILEARKACYLIVKCDPHLAEILREQHQAIGHRSHLDRRFWIAINLDGDVPTDEIIRLIAGSYDLICSGLTRKQKAELAAM